MKKVSIILLFVAIAVCMLALPSLAETIEDRAAANETALLSEYWTEGSEAVSGFNEYLLAVTDETSPDFISPEDRIAVFDLDGTLMCETYPFCFEYMVFADYALNNADSLPGEVIAVAQEINDAAGGAKPACMILESESLPGFYKNNVFSSHDNK